MKWFGSFLSTRTQKVRVGNALSKNSGDVRSGVIQGSVLGSALFTIVLDPLLRSLHLPSFAYADDVKFVIDTTKHDLSLCQADLDIINRWSIIHHMPLSIEKCLLMHCGLHNPRRSYNLGGIPLHVADTVADLGIARTVAEGYSHHIKDVVMKASRSRASGMIQRAFRQRPEKIIWLAFNIYVLPILMYVSPVWNPTKACDKHAFERVLRRLTKRIPGLSSPFYSQRLSHLRSMSLENKRLFADMILVYKGIHDYTGCSLGEFGLSLAGSSSRGAGIRLHQERPLNNMAASMFKFRAARVWNSLPLTVTSSPSLCIFKSRLRAFIGKTRT